jgi:hypothetical protein
MVPANDYHTMAQTHETPRDDNDKVRVPLISDAPTRGSIDSHAAPSSSRLPGEVPSAADRRGTGPSVPAMVICFSALIAVCAGLIGGFVGVKVAGAGASSATTAASAHGVQ